MRPICPKCRAEMHQYERNGVTVDQCSECRGIFLDRGELERLTTAESQWYGRPPPMAPYGVREPYAQRPQPRRKRSFLEDLFD